MRHVATSILVLFLSLVSQASATTIAEVVANGESLNGQKVTVAGRVAEERRQLGEVRPILRGRWRVDDHLRAGALVLRHRAWSSHYAHRRRRQSAGDTHTS